MTGKFSTGAITRATTTPTTTPYGIERHCHLLAAWAASRAASVKGCRFSVEQGRAILESAGFDDSYSTPEMLPAPTEMDEKHWAWRAALIDAAEVEGVKFTNGVAAKLVNVYLKIRFVCGGHHAHERVHQLHPPIDAVLLKKLGAFNIGGHAKAWRKAELTRWSKFNSNEYEAVIGLIRDALQGEPLWMIEEHWQGNQ